LPLFLFPQFLQFGPAFLRLRPTLGFVRPLLPCLRLDGPSGPFRFLGCFLLRLQEFLLLLLFDGTMVHQQGLVQQRYYLVRGEQLGRRKVLRKGCRGLGFRVLGFRV
jgi:hypothetical protein